MAMLIGQLKLGRTGSLVVDLTTYLSVLQLRYASANVMHSCGMIA